MKVDLHKGVIHVLSSRFPKSIRVMKLQSLLLDALKMRRREEAFDAFVAFPVLPFAVLLTVPSA